MCYSPHHSRNLEWQCGSILLLLGCFCIFWPNAFGDGRFSAITNVIPTQALTTLLLMVGITRLTFLYLNGMWPKISPILRMVGAIIGGMIFLQMALALWLSHLNTGIDPSPGIAVYANLICVEAYSAVRAAANAAHSR